MAAKNLVKDVSEGHKKDGGVAKSSVKSPIKCATRINSKQETPTPKISDGQHMRNDLDALNLGKNASGGQKKIENATPKHNPFLMHSDFPFGSQSRFPIDSRKVDSSEIARKQGVKAENPNASDSKGTWNIAARMKSSARNDSIVRESFSKNADGSIVVRSNASSVKVSTNNSFRSFSNEPAPSPREDAYIEESDEDSEGLIDSDPDIKPHMLEFEAVRKTEKELSRLKWNGQSLNKGNNELLGKGQRSIARKHK